MYNFSFFRLKLSNNFQFKKLNHLATVLILSLLLLASQTIYAQPGGYAFRMQANNNFGTAYVLNNNSPTTGILSTTVQAASTANNYLVEWDGYWNKWTNTNHNKNAEQTLFWGGGNYNGSDGVLNGGFINGKWYSLQIRGLSYSNRQSVIMETDNVPQTFHSTNSTAVSTPTAVCAGSNATINITLAGSKSAQERVFIRYAINNNFAASKVVEATGTGSTWTVASATIPGADHTASTTINYYAFTTTVAATNSSDHDLITLRFGNNGGSNYSYEVNALPTVSAGGAVNAICQSGTTAALGGSFGGGATSAVWSDGGAGGSFTNNGGSTPGTATYTAASNSGTPVTLTLTSSGGSC